jgi:hemin uptake protein HemP
MTMTDGKMTVADSAAPPRDDTTPAGPLAERGLGDRSRDDGRDDDRDGDRDSTRERRSAPADRPVGLPLFHITELVGAGREALISHEGQTYRLRITSNRKLILTK